jgi:hypothetical protein
VSSPFSRFRRKDEVPVGNNKVLVGTLLKKRKSDHVVVQTTKQFSGNSTTFRSGIRTWDQVNPKSRSKNRILPVYQEGGPFLRVKFARPDYEVKGSGTYTTVPEDSDPSFYYEYHGGFCEPDFGGTDVVTSASYNQAGLQPGNIGSILVDPVETRGPEAYAKLRPQLEKAGLAVALREAKDIPRMLQSTARGFKDFYEDMGGNKSSTFLAPRSVSDHFLNHQFGWVPFVSDIVKFHNVFQNSERYIDDITNRNGKWSKRFRVIEETESDTLISTGAIGGCFPNINVFPWNMCRNVLIGGNNSSHHWSIREEKRKRVWAVGRFTYYRPEFDRSLPDYSSQWNDAQRRLTIFGARLSPSNLYKSTPWTWLADWFSNLGDVIDIANDAALDAIACKYMYVMQHTVRRLVFRLMTNYWKVPLHLEWYRYLDTAQRAVAKTPYSFSLLPNGLSGRQVAILSALGISRGSN